MTSSSSSHGGARLGSNQDPDMRQCNTIDELVQLAYDHLDTISPRGMAAFWSLLMKHVQNQHGDIRVHLNKQLDAVLCITLKSMYNFDGREISTIAISLAKVMKQVESRRQGAATGSLHRILHSLLVGINSEKKQFILDKVANSSVLILSEFDARSLSNLIYSFGLAEYKPNLIYLCGLVECAPKVEDGRTILDVLALAAMSKLHHFNSQDLSNMLWSYAKLESSNLVLFKAAGDLIVVKHDLSEFWPQHFSNILWSYATAGQSHPKLFSKLGDNIVAMRDLGQFKPQDLSNILWSYATTGKSHPLLFQKLALVAISRCNKFNPQEIANSLWAHATVGIIDQHLFTSFAPAVKSVLGQCNSQALANIAWAYAVANVNDPSLFNSDFMNAIQLKANDFSLEGYRQLHQWQLWQDELKSGIKLHSALHENCRQALLSQLPQPSILQDDVVSVLSSMGMSPEEEVLTLSGYRLDALVEVNGKKVGIEVDGPSHFINREATGSTLLKRRQVSILDGICIVSVPFWDWDKFGMDRAKKQQYLRSKLDAKLLSVISKAGERQAISTKHSQLLQGRRQAPTSSGLAALRSEWQTCQQQGERGRGEIRYPNNDGGHDPAVLTDINYVNRKHLWPSDHSYNQARKRSRRV